LRWGVDYILINHQIGGQILRADIRTEVLLLNLGSLNRLTKDFLSPNYTN